VVDGTDNEPTEANAGDPAPVPPADERGEKPISFDFKLRLGSRESTAALTGRGTGELVQLQPIDWDSFTGLRDDDAPREYKTDGDLPSLIVELANQIAGPDTLAQAALRMNELSANRADPEWKTDTGFPADDELEPGNDHIAAAPDVPVATIDDDPMLSSVVGQILDAPAEAPPAPPPAAAPAPAPVVAPAPAPAAPAAAASAVAPAVRAPVQEVPEGPIELPRIVALTPDLPSGENAQAPHVTPSGVPVSTPSGSVSVPVVPTSGPVMLTGAEALAMAAATPAPVAPAPVAAAPIAPLQLAKIERKPGAERPTKPVDFHSLLGEAGLQPQTVKKRKKRHPFRTLFKLIVVLGVIGGGLYFGKKYVLDMRWDSELKPYAEEVAETRSLDWNKAVTMTTLPLPEYADRLTTMAFGAEADEDALAAEWRAMGLLEGELDLRTVGEYAAGLNTAVYDPSDQVIYVLDDVPNELRDLHLYRALDMALLDQHFMWSEGLETLSQSERTGRMALVSADASEVAWRIIGPSSSNVDEVTEQVTNHSADLGVEIGRMIDYPVDQTVGPTDEVVNLFADGSVSDIEQRDEILRRSVSNDAAVLDGLRGLSDNATDLGASARVAGMTYWYYVLAGRLNDADAWNAAAAWDGDETEFDSGADGDCVTATISAIDEPGRLLLLSALQEWAAAAPPEATTTVVEVGSERIDVRSCDPGPEADTKLDEPTKFFGLAGDEYGLVAELSLSNDEVERTCIINAVRNFGVMALPPEQATQAKDTTDAILESCAEA
jgi:hypothetical protein